MESTDYSHLLPVVTNTFGEDFLRGVNNSTFLGKASQTAYQSWFGEQYLQENSLYLILGTDSGLLIEYFLKQEMPRGTRLILVELPEVLAWLRDHKPGLLEPKEGITVVSDQEFIDKIEELDIKAYIYLDTFYLTRSFAVTDLFYGPYREMAHNILQFAESYHWHLTTSLSTRLFTINQLYNLADNRIHASSLTNAFTGKTAVLLAGGPSLEQAIPWLKTHQEQLLIIAVSRISKRLQQVGITPDIIFSIDPNPVNFNVSKEMFHFAEDALLISRHHLYPPLLNQWKGQHVYTGNLYPWHSPANLETEQRAGSTVTNVALEMAILMGCSTVYLAGVDLCFDSRGFTHAKGSQEFSAGPKIEGGETTILTNDGRTAETTFAYKTAAANLSSLALWGKKIRNTRIVNTNPGAARMEGIDHCPVERLTVTPEETISGKETRRIINEHIEAAVPYGEVEHCEAVTKELLRTQKVLEEIIRLSEKALLANERLFQGRTRNRKYIREMDAVEERLNGQRFTFLRDLVKSFGIKNFLAILKPDLTSADWQEKDIEEAGRQYYQAYKNSAEELHTLLDTCRARLRLRMEEHEPSPTLPVLLDGWEKAGTPGRTEIFLALNRPAVDKADQETRERFFSLAEEFARLIREGIALPEQQGKDTAWDQQRIRTVRVRLLDLFRNQERESLALVVTELARAENALTRPLLDLARGLLKELDGDYDGAKAMYQNLIESGDTLDPHLLEDALQRVCSIALEQRDQENAVLALQCLYDLSVSYGPQYARILALTGRINEALEIYAQYLGQMPDDIDAMLALGRLYRQLDFPDGVAMAVEHVLARSPDNPQALELKKFCDDRQNH